MKSGQGLLLLLTTTIAAQTRMRSVEELTNALSVADPATVAWAAQHAREFGDKRLRGPLLTTLERWSDDRDAEKTRVCLHLLDALVGLDTRVPAERVATFVDDADCGVVAFVLLAHEPQQNERLLLQVFRRAWLDEHGTRRTDAHMRAWAIGNLLAAQAAPGFSAVIAGNLQLDLEVRIAGAAQTLQISFHKPPPSPPEPSGFPPKPVYALVRAAQTAGERRLAPGIVTIDFTRTLVDENAATSWLILNPDPLQGVDDDGLGWLLLMAELPALPERHLIIDKVDAQHFVADVVKARDELQRAIDELRTRLVERGALTADEAKLLEHKVAVHIEDNRPGSPPPLPQIPDAR